MLLEEPVPRIPFSICKKGNVPSASSKRYVGQHPQRPVSYFKKGNCSCFEYLLGNWQCLQKQPAFNIRGSSGRILCWLLSQSIHFVCSVMKYKWNYQNMQLIKSEGIQTRVLPLLYNICSWPDRIQIFCLRFSKSPCYHNKKRKVGIFNGLTFSLPKLANTIGYLALYIYNF